MSIQRFPDARVSERHQPMQVRFRKPSYPKGPRMDLLSHVQRAGMEGSLDRTLIRFDSCARRPYLVPPSCVTVYPG